MAHMYILDDVRPQRNDGTTFGHIAICRSWTRKSNAIGFSLISTATPQQQQQRQITHIFSVTSVQREWEISYIPGKCELNELVCRFELKSKMVPSNDVALNKIYIFTRSTNTQTILLPIYFSSRSISERKMWSNILYIPGLFYANERIANILCLARVHLFHPSQVELNKCIFFCKYGQSWS